MVIYIGNALLCMFWVVYIIGLSRIFSRLCGPGDVACFGITCVYVNKILMSQQMLVIYKDK